MTDLPSEVLRQRRADPFEAWWSSQRSQWEPLDPTARGDLWALCRAAFYAGPSHDCPDAAGLRPGHDDLCDLPEPVRRLAYVSNLVPGDHSWVHEDCPGHFCPHAVFSEVVAAFRAVIRR